MKPARKFNASGPDDPISERDLLERFPWIGASRLRDLALQGKVRFIRGQRRSRWYGPDEIRDLIETLKTPCPDRAALPYSRSPANGSTPSPAGLASGVSGMTPELKRSVALAFAQKI